MVLSLILHKHYVNNSGLLLVVLLYLDKVLGQLCKPKDCIDLKCYRVSTAKRGAYIYPNSPSLPKILVTCQQTGDGGGWIVYLRRFDGSVIFNRTFAEYKNGFGQQGRQYESWLGNENVHQLVKTFNGGAKLRLEGYLRNGDSCVITAKRFKLEDEGMNYVIKLGQITSTHAAVVNNLAYHRNRIFTAKDSNRLKCRTYTGGWWYHSCHMVYLTGTWPPSYKSKYTYTSMYFEDFGNEPMKAANMLFRPMVTTRVCNNPCQHNGVCEYVESTNNYHCACPETHCGLHCEKKYPCKNNGTCVYSAKTKNISCVCGASYTGTLCEVRVTTTTTMTTTTTTTTTATTTIETVNTTTLTTTTEANVVPVIIGGIISLMLLIILATIAVCMYLVGKKKKAAREEEENRRRKEEEEAEEEEEVPDNSMFGFFSSMFA